MKKQPLILLILIGFVTFAVMILFNLVIVEKNEASLVYQVYLDGKVIGVIEDKDALFALINKEQKSIKDEYNVDNVYPPDNLEINKIYTYDSKVDSIEEVYEKIEENENFTIDGYKIIIKSTNNEEQIDTTDEAGDSSVTPEEAVTPSEEQVEIEPRKEDTGVREISINVLDKEIFDDAIHSFILAFIDEKQYNNYINDTQAEIEDVGSIIENMYFNEDIIVKKGKINVNEKIYTKENDLTRYLLFGDNNEEQSYSVKEGDTISSISDEYKLNPQEFLVANPKYTSEDSLLAIGDTVDVTLINPVLTLTYQLYSVEDVETKYETKVVRDNSKPSSYSEITQPGVNGLSRVTYRYAVINGEQTQGMIKLSENVIREKVDQVTTKGKKQYSSGNYGTFVAVDGDFGWPTNQPYKISSRYGYRWGKLHMAVDISGLAQGSPVYAAADGVVVYAGNTGGSSGTYIVIQHDNNIYTNYAHLVKNSFTVKEGDHVTKGQKIGGIGQTGMATGVHLHFGAFVGYPNREGSKSFNPCSLYKNMC